MGRGERRPSIFLRNKFVVVKLLSFPEGLFFFS